MVIDLNKLSLWGISSTVFLASVLIAASSHAQEQEALALEKLITEADLVFEGTVEKIQYSNSAPAGPEQKPIPHTFLCCICYFNFIPI